MGSISLKSLRRLLNTKEEVYMNSKGFTLTELIIVVAIIGILAMIAIPAYIGQQKRAARTEAYSNLETLRILEEQYYADNGRYAPDPDASWTYKGTYGTDDNGIEDVLRGFKPGDKDALSFDYTLSSYGSGTGFMATASGTKSRVSGDSFWIDHNNNKNF
jgi:prepilin-type N-terminal cleavage/methylation domain-containing protein